jgi:hypothetical protein
MGSAARLAHYINKKLKETDPVAYQIKVDRMRHEREVKTLKDKFADDLAAMRRELTAELAGARRELIASRSEVEHLKAANADLQCRVQERDAAMNNLKAVNADLEQQLRACANVSRLIAEAARGETGGVR